jgi:hypothetical protein
MHISWLYRDQGAEARRVFQDELRNKPRVNKAIVCVNKDPLTAALFTPARYIHNTLEIGGLFSVAGLGASGKELNTFIQESFCHGNAFRPSEQTGLAPFFCVSLKQPIITDPEQAGRIPYRPNPDQPYSH